MEPILDLKATREAALVTYKKQIARKLWNYGFESKLANIRNNGSLTAILTLPMTGSKKWRDEGAALFAVRVDGVVMAHGLWGWPRGRNELKTKNANDSAGNTVNVDF